MQSIIVNNSSDEVIVISSSTMVILAVMCHWLGYTLCLNKKLSRHFWL